MVLTVHLLLLVIATILFFIAALPVPTGSVNLIGLGLFFLTLSFIFV